jgi:subtilisin-like proprotein convertase family protein
MAAFVAAVPIADGAAASSPTGAPLAASVLDQLAAIEADKAERSVAEQKVDANLLYAAREQTEGQAVAGVPDLESTVEVDRGMVLVDISGAITDALERAVDALGGEVVATVPEFDSMRARLPVQATAVLAERPDVRAVAPADEATTHRSESPGGVAPSEVAGSAVAATSGTGIGANEADVTMRVAQARASFGLDGSGVKVCVLSDGVSSLAARQATGDLPAVDVLSGQAGTGDEGTAMLELIADLAPAAELGFATAFSGVASFAQNIVELRADGCDVLVDDVTYFGEPSFQDGPIAQAITTVRNDGAVYLSSAGNLGNLSDGTSGTWQGDFEDIGEAGAPLGPGRRLHGWGSGAPYNTITASGGPIELQWSDPLGGSTNDHDVFLLSADGTTVIASSTNVQNGSQDPLELIATAPVGGRIVVTRKAAADARFLALHTNRGRLAHATGGAARGHNVSVDAVSVAATPAASPFDGSSPVGPFPGVHSGSDRSELFSSDGPTRQYFAPDGTPLTSELTSGGGVVRPGVDVTAPDGVTTTTPGFGRFYGTSASAPNAAAVVALARQAAPTLGPVQLEEALAASAIDIEAPGVDPVTGAGIVDAPALLAAVGAAPGAPLAMSQVAIEVRGGDGDDVLEPAERVALRPALRNVGSVPATAITATLASETADAVVTKPTTTYDDLAAGAVGSPESEPFEVQVAAGCRCGAALAFTLTIAYTGGVGPTLSVPVEVVVGAPLPDTTAAYSGPPAPIPDANPAGASATVTVSAEAPISELSVTIGGSACSTVAGATSVGIDHTYVGDLTATLTSPSGTTVTLFERTGGSGNNLCRTVLSDDALTPISGLSSAAAPFSGRFRPHQPLDAFIGEDPNGAWTLRVVDAAGSATGSIRAFSVDIASHRCSNASSVPTGASDQYGAVGGTTLNVAKPGVLANDQDGDGDLLAAALATPPASGQLWLASSGAFAYLPDPGFVGTDTFTYRVTDGTNSSEPVSVAIEVVTPAGAFVVAVYEDFLGRATDPVGAAYWVGRLDSGAETRSSFVTKMTRSREYARKIVTRAFVDTLGRVPDVAGREYWAARVQAGMPVSTLVLNLLASPEFGRRSGGTVAGFVDATFDAILGRAPTTAERSARVAAIVAGTSRLQVASDLYRSFDSRRRRTRVAFADLLGRAPSRTELELWVAALATRSDVDLAIALGSGTEYNVLASVRWLGAR